MTSGASQPAVTRAGACAAWARDRRLHVVFAALVVVAVSLQQNFAQIPKSPFHPDESRWLNRSHYFSDVLDPLSPVWEDRYLTRGQPPGGSYITGLGLLLQGRDLDTNGAWHFEYGDGSDTWWNASRGNMPASADVIAIRRTSAVFGAISALALFVIVTHLANAFGGLVAGLFLALHPLGIYLASLGVSDAAFTSIAALTTLAAMALAANPSWVGAATLGLLLGLGAATKLSPLLLAVGIGGIGFVLAAEPVLRRSGVAGRLLDHLPGYGGDRSRRLGWMLLAQPVIAVAVFVLSYPYLWPAPLWRTRTLFEFRRREMENQARIWPDASIDSRSEALQRTWGMLEHRFSTTGRIFSVAMDQLGVSAPDGGIDVPIAVAGLALLLVVAVRRGVTSPTFLGAAVAGGQAALIFGGLRVDFDRYYLPIVFLIGIGFGVLAAQAWAVARQALARSRTATLRSEQPARRLDRQPASTHRSAD